MQKLTKKLSLVMVALFTVFTMLSYAPAKAATVVPKVQFVGEQKTEFTAGERITFTLNAANYGGRVQYRVVLWNDATKSYSDLWNTADKYYTNWMPYGNETLPLGWIINEPGSYRITIYAKRAGVANSKTALTGMNCDSYLDGVAFVVKAGISEAELNAEVAVKAAETSKNQVDVDAAVKAVELVTNADAKAKFTTRLNAIVVLPVVNSVKAIGAKKLEVVFNKAVDDTKAVFAVKKSTIAVNYDKVVFAADKKSAVITTTTTLTQGDYTVSVTGLTETAITGTVSVLDVKVSKINITSDVAPRLSGNKTAQVSYQVLNQYGEKMAINTLSWTISTGVAASSDVNSAGNGTFVITAANTLDFVPGAVVYITGVHATTGTVINAQVTIALNSQSDKVVFKGVYNTSTLKLVTLPAGFADETYVMLYEVLDQYGTKIASPTFADLVFISNNPLFVASTFSALGSTVTLDDVVYQAVKLDPGTSVANGGTVTIQAISILTGKISSTDTQANALAAVKSFTMSAPAKMVSEGEVVEIPFTAVDQYGNAVTKHTLLSGNITLASGLAFDPQDDGSTKLKFTAPTTGASDGIDLPVYLTTLVTAGGNFSSLMVSVKETARPVAIVGLDAAKVTSVAKGNFVDIKAQDLIIQDQYGRTMTDTAVNAWINGASSISVASVYAASGDVSPFTVLLNNTGSDAASQVLTLSTDYVRLTAQAVVAATENVSFTLSTVAASTKVVTFAKVVQSEYVSYTVNDLGTIYNDGAATTATPNTDYDKTLKVYGVKADGTKVLLPYADYDVTTDGLLLVTDNKIGDLTDDGYASTDFVVDGNYAPVKVSVLVTVNDASGAAAAILEKELLVSNKAPKVDTVTMDEDYVTDGKATIASGTIDATDINGFVYEILDQYGIDQASTIADVDPTITITNLTKVDVSGFTVTGNGSDTTSVAGATMGDKFTVTYKYDSGVKVTVEFTVGL